MAGNHQYIIFKNSADIERDQREYSLKKKCNQKVLELLEAAKDCQDQSTMRKFIELALTTVKRGSGEL